MSREDEPREPEERPPTPTIMYDSDCEGSSPILNRRRSPRNVQGYSCPSPERSPRGIRRLRGSPKPYEPSESTIAEESKPALYEAISFAVPEGSKTCRVATEGAERVQIESEKDKPGGSGSGTSAVKTGAQSSDAKRSKQN